VRTVEIEYSELPVYRYITVGKEKFYFRMWWNEGYVIHCFRMQGPEVVLSSRLTPASIHTCRNSYQQFLFALAIVDYTEKSIVIAIIQNLYDLTEFIDPEDPIFDPIHE